MKLVRLMARKPGEKWGIRSMMNSDNARQSLPEDHKDFLSLEGVKQRAMELAVTWADMVKDDTEFKVVTI